MKKFREFKDKILTKDFLETVINSIDEAISIIDIKDYSIIGVNRKFLKDLELDEKDVLGRPCYEITHRKGHPCLPPDDLCPINDAKETGRHTVVEHIHYRGDGSKIFVEVSASPIKDRKGRVIQVVHIARDITERKRAEEELRRSHEELRNLSAYLQQIREDERAKIAREIHDELGQALTAIKMDMSYLFKKYNDHGSVSEKAESIFGVIDSTIQAIKRISTELRPGILDDLGLISAIEWQVKEFEKRCNIKCHLRIEQEDINIDKESSIAIFRLLQEGLTNIARHAAATEVLINLYESKNALCLVIDDNGKGISEGDIRNPKSFGLIGMRERVHFLGGDFFIMGNPGKGTRIEIRIPFERGVI